MLTRTLGDFFPNRAFSRVKSDVLSQQQSFAASIDLHSCRIKNIPRKIFLCGGKVKREAYEPASLRDHLVKALWKKKHGLSERIFIADELLDWFDEDLFQDLLQLEEYIASLSSLIVVICESPGSLAELGAFCFRDHFREKLMVVLEDGYRGRSFITLGPYRRVEKLNPESAQIYRWLVARDFEEPDQNLLQIFEDDLIQQIVDADHHVPTEQLVDPESQRDQLLFVADLISVFWLSHGVFHEGS